MLKPAEITTYQRQSNAAAGYCAACTKQLQPGEVYACHDRASDAYVETKGSSQTSAWTPQSES